MSRLFQAIEETALSLLLAAMTIITFLQVVLRYGFNTGWLWYLEATSLLFLWLIAIGISYCVRINAHIGVDLFVTLLRPWGQKICGLLCVGLSLMYAGLMLFGAYNAYALFGTYYRELGIGIGYLDILLLWNIPAEEIPIKEWILFLIVPIGFGLLILRSLWIGSQIISGARLGFIEKESPEAGPTFTVPQE